MVLVFCENQKINNNNNNNNIWSLSSKHVEWFCLSLDSNLRQVTLTMCGFSGVHHVTR